MHAQPLQQAERTAQLQARHALNSRIQILKTRKFLHERGGRLGADAGDALDVVDTVAGESEVIGKTLRDDAKAFFDVLIAKALAMAVVPVVVAVTNELRQILVARDEDRAHALAARDGGERADDMVR